MNPSALLGLAGAQGTGGTELLGGTSGSVGILTHLCCSSPAPVSAGISAAASAASEHWD